jgi:hypothetical protein
MDISHDGASYYRVWKDTRGAGLFEDSMQGHKVAAGQLYYDCQVGVDLGDN